MMLMKFSFIQLIMFLNFMFMILNHMNFYCMSFNYFSFFFNYMCNYYFSFFLELSNLIFFLMVSFVTWIVCFYSEIYMENYNNSKYSVLMMLFFFSMCLLVSSSSFINLMLGWDLLGLTSICLIMFYPNMITMYNSTLTMIFNRLGDVFVIFCLSYSIYYYSLFYYLNYNFSMVMFLFLLLASFTKSAQIPLSSWLPAAMSAPTPISAMVHSSTLVTAGVYLVTILINYFMNLNLNYLILYASVLTFFLSGLLATMEMDLKKIVAFSTMSQISMILMFTSMNFLTMALVHMFYHALFKTFLFCCAGFYFISIFSDQFFLFFKSLKNYNLLMFFFFSSIFSMTGLYFSSSFFSKDLILEFMYIKNPFIYVFLMLMGSFMTLSYCCKVVNMSSFSAKFYFINKNKIIKPLFIFLIVMLYCSFLFKFIAFCEMINNFSMVDTMILLILFVIFLFYNFNFKYKFLKLSTIQIFFTKHYFYSFFSNVNLFLNYHMNENFFLKKNFLMGNFLKNKFYFSFPMNLRLMLILLIMVFMN